MSKSSPTYGAASDTSASHNGQRRVWLTIRARPSGVVTQGRLVHGGL